ncbi:SusD/RagB family nutrient-binding outer membrane lipoprotein [Parapedobacter sp. ISTM3]|uniref:SusD/RagB family nutrient-binding outer membrane lipoprotein n=1 Tax=Parapedobacter sp. ISTM3 TaxID=2800130 RepID=UPI001906302A|nr:SusD/RagB family nutrient-binding outer membrane lipoprotein [Parapedobacter sp. ISTM3]MBK1442387.1 SusD/RagB family nutrient-binding outer membrane lipoprotein [Parapedobacter sp. ISTM3]
MKKLNGLLILVVALLAISCTDNFTDLNSDPSALPNVGAREMPFMFSRAQSAAVMDRSFYQTVQNLGADLYAQYYALSVTSFQTDRYVLTPDWQRRFWTVVYTNTAPQLKAIIENAPPASGEQALAHILWVYAFHRLTDHFGPVPYFQAADPIEEIPYDSQAEIYDDFFKRLDQAVNDLNALGADARVFQGFDLMYDGDVNQWIAFANTLRLRLALRISLVDPDRAQSEAEAAVAAGVMTDNSQHASLLKSLRGNDTNGLAQVAAWNEFAMSSTMASYLKGYADPRLQRYFQPDVTNGEYNSLRNGLPAAALNNPRNTSAQNANVGTYWVVWNAASASWMPNLEARQHVMNAAEAWFLRAEGALNGWNMGATAQECYEQGIAVSLSQWGANQAAIDAYLISTATPVAPGDSENSPAVANTPIRWAADAATQRAQIGVQKWLAIFPDGMEAWAEFRRTGFPAMYPVVQSNNPDLPQGTFINRMPFPIVEENNNAAELAKGRALLNGADNAATRVWWDVD